MVNLKNMPGRTTSSPDAPTRLTPPSTPPKFSTTSAAILGLGIAIISLFIICVTVTPIRLWLQQQWTLLTSASVSQSNAEPTPIPTPTPDPLAPITFALLGYGGGGHEGGKLTDSIIVAKIMPKDQVVTLISVPRDLWIELPIAAEQLKPFKINAAYAIGSDTRQYLSRPAEFQGEHGGGALAKKALSEVVGFPIDYYIAVSFANFHSSVDALGGVDVEVPFSFSDDFYPLEGKEKDTCGRSEEDIASLTATMSGYKLEQQFPCRYEKIDFAKGTQHMDAATALKFVRSRHSNTNGSDFGRSLRQQAFLKAAKQKVLSLSFLPKLIPFIEKNLKGTSTDINLALITKLLGLYQNPADFKLQSVAISDQNVLKPGKSSDGQYILQPKEAETGWQSIRQFVIDSELQLATASASPAPKPTTIPAPTQQSNP